MEIFSALVIGVGLGLVLAVIFYQRKIHHLQARFQNEIESLKKSSASSQNNLILTQSMRAAKPWLKFLYEMHHELWVSAKNIQFDHKDPVSAYLVMLHCSMIELINSLVILFRDRSTVAVATLVRDILENFARTKVLIVDPTYIYRMDFMDLTRRIKFLENAKLKKNKFQSALSDFSQVEEKLQEFKSAREKIPKIYHGRARVDERFKLANMSEEYEAIYPWLSLSPHSEADILIERHLGSENNNISLYKEITPENSIVYLSMASQWAVESTLLIYKYFASSDINKVNVYEKRLHGLVQSFYVEK